MKREKTLLRFKKRARIAIFHEKIPGKKSIKNSIKDIEQKAKEQGLTSKQNP